MSNLTVRAIDLGWGYTKFTALRENNIEFLSIPSLAPKHTGIDLSGSIFGRRNTVVVDIEGTKYEVGFDSTDLDPNDSTRNLNEQYVFTDQYKSVFLGCLHYMNTPDIDLLILGLPLSHMHHVAHLKSLAIGKHEVNGKTYHVKSVEVLPQPVGGLNYCFSLSDVTGFDDLKDSMNLVVDPGFLTFDFLVSNGNRPVDTRSGAHTGGVSKVLRAMADSISRRYGIKFDNLSSIDRALQKNKLRINGEVVPLEPHIMDAKSVVDGSISYMKNIVGSGADLDNIILLGGGSFIYKKTLSAAYPNHKILFAPDSQMANVRGFYLAGLQIANSL